MGGVGTQRWDASEHASSFLFTGTISGAVSYPFFIAHRPCLVTAAALTIWDGGATITADDTNYWTVVLRRTRAGSAVTIATKTTQATGGQTATSRQAWVFDPATFTAANAVLAANDILDFAFTPTGSPTAWNKCAGSVLLR